jgi:hypothetical protein
LRAFRVPGREVEMSSRCLLSGRIGLASVPCTRAVLRRPSVSSSIHLRERLFQSRCRVELDRYTVGLEQPRRPGCPTVYRSSSTRRAREPSVSQVEK